MELPLAGFFLKKVRTMRADVNDLYTLDPELYNNLMFLRDYTVSRALATWTTIAQHMCEKPVARPCLAWLLSCWLVSSGWAAVAQPRLLTEAARCLQGEFGDLALSFTTAESVLDGNQEVSCDGALKQHAQSATIAQHRVLAVHPCLAAQFGWGLGACCCNPDGLAGCCVELHRKAPIFDAAPA